MFLAQQKCKSSQSVSRELVIQPFGSRVSESVIQGVSQPNLRWIKSMWLQTIRVFRVELIWLANL